MSSKGRGGKRRDTLVVDAYHGHGGSYVIDPETGERKRVGGTAPAVEAVAVSAVNDNEKEKHHVNADA